MTGCDYCKKSVEGLPHKCKYCGKVHCSNHLLPENHNCEGLKEYSSKNSERWKKNFSEIVSPKNKEYEENINYSSKNNQTKKEHKRKIKPSEKIKYFLSDKFYNSKKWLSKRDHWEYNFNKRKNYLFKIILILFLSIIGLFFFYSRADQFNQISLWIFNLGGILILTSLFFTIKFGWKLGKGGINILKRQRNWLKYLIVILIILLLWQAYANKDSVLNPVFNTYNKTNFSLFAPINLGNFSLNTQNAGTSSNYGGGSNSGNQEISSPLQPKIDISSLEMEIHNLINTERQNNGLSSLSFDSKLAEIARGHSQDMAQNNFFEHTNLRGQDPTDRATANGYNCYKDYGSYYTEGIAENIFQNNLYDSITYVDFVPFHDWNTQSEIAQSTVQGWMESPGHRQNILTSTYDKEGIGVAISSDDKVYITEDFC